MRTTLSTELRLPVLIAGAGELTAVRFIELFTENIRPEHAGGACAGGSLPSLVLSS
ncbi:MAG: hypothetical protein ABSC05_24045 [Candidatus Solibacter sp.]